MVKGAAQAVKAEKPEVLRVLGGISPIDPYFITTLKNQGTLNDLNAIAVHGFPLDRVPCIHRYSLYDLPRAWQATTRHREAEGSSYYRQFSMGLLHEDGSPKLALDAAP